MAISLSEIWGFANKGISDFFDRDSNQLDPRLVPFKRIDDISNCIDIFKFLAENLELAEKFSFEIECLSIEKYHFNDLRKLYKDKDPNLMIECLYYQIRIENKVGKKLHQLRTRCVTRVLFSNFIFYSYLIVILYYVFEHNLSNKKIEFINKFSPKKLLINKDKWTVGNIKALTLLNCANVEINFGIMINEDIYLWFENTPIKLFDSNSDQLFIFEWDSIKIFIEINEYDNEYDDEKNGIEELKLLKTNTGSFLFIPLDTIHQIEYLGFREILRSDDINKQFADSGFHNQLKENGLIIPMGYSNRIFIGLKDNKLDYLNQYKEIYKVFKDKQMELTIISLDRLLEINELFLDDFSRINFNYYNSCLTEMSSDLLSRIMRDPDLINLKFIQIYQNSILSPNEFLFWWNVLHSRSTRFSLASISLRFSLLSECLTVLSLCFGCSELKSVYLGYSNADTVNEDEAIEQAKREFRQNFGLFKIWVWKNEE